VSHGNARLTFHGRRTIVDRVVGQRRPKAHVAKEMGVSRKTVAHWVGRFETEGESGLRDRSSRPLSSPTRTSAQLEQQVVALRRQTRRGQDWIGPELGVPARTVSRILRRQQLPYLRDCDPLTGQVIRASKTTAVRYERDRPGELVHMDVKKIGRIPDGGGWRAHGRGAASIARDRSTKVGFDYVHSLVDDHSRAAYSEILGDENAATTAGFFARAAKHFASLGIHHIEAVMTDNAWNYTRSNALAELLDQLGTRHVLIKAHCPWQNGKVERFNRTLQTEWAYRHVFTSNNERANALEPWLTDYNLQRRHSALGGLPPISRLSPT
jgi:transposase InsO family protein